MDGSTGLEMEQYFLLLFLLKSYMRRSLTKENKKDGRTAI